jgi:hypothetical protein
MYPDVLTTSKSPNIGHDSGHVASSSAMTAISARHLIIAICLMGSLLQHPNYVRMFRPMPERWLLGNIEGCHSTNRDGVRI